MSDLTLDYILNQHPLYQRYIQDWQMCLDAFHGGVEWRNGKYLRAYTTDVETPSESINTYQINSDGSVVSKYKVKLENSSSSRDTQYGNDDTFGGNFYTEKLQNTPLYNYTKLIVSEYNAILFRNLPYRDLPDSPETQAFMRDVDGEGNSINEFMSLVDMFSTIFGVVHVGCYKFMNSDMPRWQIHLPTDVTNWEYYYDAQGNLTLGKIVIKVNETDEMKIYRCMTAEYIDTVFVGPEDDDDWYPEVPGDLEEMDTNVYRIREVNELGYIPITTIYQSTKVYNNIGSTVVSDAAQIQRSIYGDLAEIYSAITYGAHPVLVIDEETDQLNGGATGAEPGSVVRVRAGMTGESTYTYEFKAPQLDAISEIQSLIDSKINKLCQVAMLRSEELIRTANSGAQIEIYDDKLNALIRKKATNLENAEAQLWSIWSDWMNQNLAPVISYNRQFGKRSLEQELMELDKIMAVIERYRSLAPDAPLNPEITSTVAQRIQQLMMMSYSENAI